MRAQSVAELLTLLDGELRVVEMASDAFAETPGIYASAGLAGKRVNVFIDNVVETHDTGVKTLNMHLPSAHSQPAVAAAPSPSTISPVERLQALQNIGQNVTSTKSYSLARTHEVDAEMEERLKKAENVNGAFLKAAREYKKISAEEIMDVLKISKNYLSALEEDNVAKLPANVFVRGFVLQYAKTLKLEHEKVTAAYMEFLRSKRTS